jgi:hypothetical protein
VLIEGNASAWALATAIPACGIVDTAWTGAGSGVAAATGRGAAGAGVAAGTGSACAAAGAATGGALATGATGVGAIRLGTPIAPGVIPGALLLKCPGGNQGVQPGTEYLVVAASTGLPVDRQDPRLAQVLAALLTGGGDQTVVGVGLPCVAVNGRPGRMNLPGECVCAVVALDPRDGSIRALASYPTYRPSLFSGRVRQRALDAAGLTSLTARGMNYPALYRATDATYPPGSTF